MGRLAILLVAATWQTDDIERGQASLAFSATIVPVASVEWDEFWRGDQGIAAGHYSDPDRRVAFVVPLRRGEAIVLSPDMPSGWRDGVQYAGLDDYATEVVAWR